jgi:ribosomal protein S17
MTHKKFKVNDVDEQARVGDYVEFYVGRPVSKEKYMHLHKILKKASSI